MAFQLIRRLGGE